MTLPATTTCTAHSKNTGKPCKWPAIKGGTVCRYHGGAAPQVKRQAAKRLAAFRADHFLVRHHEQIEPIEDPVEALTVLAGEAWAAKEYFASQIEELRYKAGTGEQLRAEVALWERAMDRCMKILSEIKRLGIAEHHTRVAETQAVMMLAVVDKILDRLDLDQRQKAISIEIVAEEFEAIASGPVA